MKTITLVGAGGKMGCRLTDNFLKTHYKVHYLEVSPKGLENWEPSEKAFRDFYGTFSAAAYKISKRAKPVLFKEGWQKIFDLADIREQVRDITQK